MEKNLQKKDKKKKKKKKPEKCVDVKRARELQKSWCDTRTPEIDKCLGFEDTREFWWSVEELQQYLKYVKRESKKQGIENPGIRMYFGAYPKEECKMNHGYATIFLSPTGAPAGEQGKGRDGQPNNYGVDAYNGGFGGRPPRNY